MDQIELHDSRVAAERRDRAIVLRLCPAYVHHWEQIDGAWVGEGRSQTAEIILADGTVDCCPEAASGVADGWLEVAGRRYESMLPVPFTAVGATRGQLELFTPPPVEFSASGVTIRLVGEPRFVEALPLEWAPGAG